MKYALFIMFTAFFTGCSLHSQTLSTGNRPDLYTFEFIKNSTNPADLSGVAWVPDTKSFYMILNQGELIFEVDENFQLIREIETLGFSDTEDIAFVEMSEAGPIFGILEEQGVIALGVIPKDKHIIKLQDFKRIVFENYHSIFQLWAYNKGAEGLAYNADKNVFYVAKEKWPMALLVVPNPKGSNTINVAATPLLSEKDISRLKKEITDISAINYDQQNNTLYILSDESHKVIKFNLDTKNMLVHALVIEMPQAEGITLFEKGKILVVSEPYYGQIIPSK